MTINKSELSKLSPEERIKKLKQLELAKKKEAEEIGDLIKASERELKTGKLAGEITPEQKPVDISRLFEAGGGENLERTARQEVPQNFMKGGKSYQAFVQTYQDYSKLKNFYGILATGGSLTQDQIAAIGQIGERINKVEKYMTEG